MAAQRGVHVLTQAAEELFDHHDGEEVADQEGPVGQRHGADKGQQHAGNGGGEISAGRGAFPGACGSPTSKKNLTAQHRHHGHGQGAGTKDIHRHRAGTRAMSTSSISRLVSHWEQTWGGSHGELQ